MALLLAGFLTQGCALGADEFAVLNDSTLCEEVNGCTRSTAKSYTGSGSVSLSFDADGYAEACVILSPNTQVSMTGVGVDFNDFPIVGGIYPDSIDAQSPIKNPPDPKGSATFIGLADQCVYPYFSTNNPGLMHGAIFIDLN